MARGPVNSIALSPSATGGCPVNSYILESRMSANNGYPLLSFSGEGEGDTMISRRLIFFALCIFCLQLV